MSDELARLAAEKYIVLTSFRKDGTAVPTPVWVARDGDELVVFTAPDAGKVKRIRRDGAVRVGPCTVRGVPTGDDVPARARILDEAAARHTMKLIARKYGLFGRITVLGSRLRRRRTGPGAIAITLD
jgi:PPOX class probable F420-dependent enzyme